jgi:alcohol dehydrogenase class IV
MIKMDEIKNILLKLPRKVFFGQDCSSNLLSECQQKGIKKVFVLTVSFLKESVEQMFAVSAAEGIDVDILIVEDGEPSFQYFEEILKDAKQFNPDGVVGIGGGSVMDTAKLVAALVDGDQLWSDVVGNGLIHDRKTWLACFPTTAGTGSEVSPNAIFLDKRDLNKKGVISEYLVPDAAFIDPSLMLSVPPLVTAFTGMDALIHCLEAYFNKFSHPMVDLYAVEGIRLITENLEKVVKDGDDIEGRSKVALGSMYGGMCLGPVNTAGVHALAYPLGSLYGIAHGLSNALMLIPVLKFNLFAVPERFCRLTMALGIDRKTSEYETGLELIKKIEELIKKCNLPAGLSRLNIPSDAINKIAAEAMKVDRLLKNNPREIDLESAKALYAEAF